MFTIKITEDLTVTIDAEDWQKVGRYKWHKHSGGYVHASIDGQKVLLHRLVMSASKGDRVDHISGDKTDNRKSNLRFCNAIQNAQNSVIRKHSAKYKGVSWNTRRREYEAYGNEPGTKRKVHLGWYKSAYHAALAYNEYASANYGDFAKLNQV